MKLLPHFFFFWIQVLGVSQELQYLQVSLGDAAAAWGLHFGKHRSSLLYLFLPPPLPAPHPLLAPQSPDGPRPPSPLPSGGR